MFHFYSKIKSYIRTLNINGIVYTTFLFVRKHGKFELIFNKMENPNFNCLITVRKFSISISYRFFDVTKTYPINDDRNNFEVTTTLVSCFLCDFNRATNQYLSISFIKRTIFIRKLYTYDTRNSLTFLIKYSE